MRTKDKGHRTEARTLDGGTKAGEKPVFAFVLCLLSFVLPAAASSSDYTDWRKSDGTPQSVMLSYYDGPDTRGFAWQTAKEVTSGKLWVVAGEHGSGDSVFDSSSSVTATSASHDDCYTHKAHVTGLSAGIYSYRLGTVSHYAYGKFEVRDRAKPFVAVNITDIQLKSADKLSNWKNVVKASNTVLGGGPNADTILYCGDFFDKNNNPREAASDYVRWGVTADQACPEFADVAWTMVSGNHDPGYFDTCIEEHFNYGDKDHDNYGCHSFDYGNVHVATLPHTNGDSKEKSAEFNDDVKRWLKNDLLAAQGSTWRILVVHMGPYTTGDHGYVLNSSYIRDFAGICAQYKVDLVLQGHDHTYSKTLPYRWSGNGYASSSSDSAAINLSPATVVIGGETYYDNPEGTVYVSAGCAGDRVGENSSYASSTYKNRSDKIATDKVNVKSAYASVGDDGSKDVGKPMFAVLTIDGETLKYDWYVAASSTPELLDTLRITKTPSDPPDDPDDPPDDPSASGVATNLYCGCAVTSTGAERVPLADSDDLVLRFTESGTLVVTNGFTADILVVGGGGAGVMAKSSSSNKYNGNGGNGGSASEVFDCSLPAGSYAITVGAGAKGVTKSVEDFTGGTDAEASSITAGTGVSGFETISAEGGTAWETRDDSGSGTKSSSGKDADSGSGANLASAIAGESYDYGKSGIPPPSDQVQAKFNGADADEYGEGGQGSANGGTSGAGANGVVIVRIRAVGAPPDDPPVEPPDDPGGPLTRTVSGTDNNWGAAVWSDGTTAGSVAWKSGADAEITVSGAATLDVGSAAVIAGKLTLKGTGDLTLANFQNLTAGSIDLSGLAGTVTYEYVSSSASRSLPGGLADEIKKQTDQRVKYAFRGTSAANGWNLGSWDKTTFRTHIIIDLGTHTWSQNNNGSGGGLKFGENGTDENPTLLVKDGATLNFTAKDLSGYQGEFVAGGVIRVNAGGTLNFKYSNGNMNYRQRLVLEPGSLTTFDYGSSSFFVLHGAGATPGSTATEATANVYVPASDGTAAPAILRQIGGAGLCINSMGSSSDNRGGGCAIWVGANSKLILDSKVSKGEGSSGDRVLAKLGSGELEITGEIMSDVTYAGPREPTPFELLCASSSSGGGSALEDDMEFPENGVLTVPAGAEFVLDLKGHAITCHADGAIVNNGKLTIIDSAKASLLAAHVAYSAAEQGAGRTLIRNGGELVIDGVFVDAGVIDGVNSVFGGGNTAIAATGGSVTVKNGAHVGGQTAIDAAGDVAVIADGAHVAGWRGAAVALAGASPTLSVSNSTLEAEGQIVRASAGAATIVDSVLATSYTTAPFDLGSGASVTVGKSIYVDRMAGWFPVTTALANEGANLKVGAGCLLAVASENVVGFLAEGVTAGKAAPRVWRTKGADDEALPPLTDEEKSRIAEILASSPDRLLAKNITEVKDYMAYRAWVDKGVEAGTIDSQAAAKGSEGSFFSFATDQNRIVDPAEITEEKVKVEEVKVNGGEVTLTVGIDGVPVGENAQAEYLGKVFGVTGTAALDEEFATEKVTYGNMRNNGDGTVSYSAEPKVAEGEPKPDAFFFKARVAR